MAQNCIHLIHSYFNFHCIPIYSYKNTVKNPLAAPGAVDSQMTTNCFLIYLTHAVNQS